MQRGDSVRLLLLYTVYTDLYQTIYGLVIESLTLYQDTGLRRWLVDKASLSSSRTARVIHTSQHDLRKKTRQLRTARAPISSAPIVSPSR